ncbi:MAG: hypothetical protein IT305_24755 [Chloroflexi bacterium]|nr:hypothetical protein [Chloroflexota bacterium]
MSLDDAVEPEEGGDEAPPIGLSSRDLAIMLGQAVADLKDEGQTLNDDMLVVLIAAAIEANNRQVYEDLRASGLLHDA